MKSSLIALPVLIEIALVAVLYFSATAAPVSPPLSAQPLTEIRQLHQQRDQIEDRLAALESRTRVFLPRGMGSVAGGAPLLPAPSANPAPKEIN